MAANRENDAMAKRLRARLRREGRHCHICGYPIDYKANHLDPMSFQVDHLLQIANGGPAHDYDNLDAAHRKCNRTRSDTIDAIAIAAAGRYGITLAPQAGTASVRDCGTPDGVACEACGGTHNPSPGVEFVTARRWWAATTAGRGRVRRR